jgi:xylose isomerase
VQEALTAAGAVELAEPTVNSAGDASAETLKREAQALDSLAVRGYANERLDQLLVEVLLGTR